MNTANHNELSILNKSPLELQLMLEALTLKVEAESGNCLKQNILAGQAQMLESIIAMFAPRTVWTVMVKKTFADQDRNSERLHHFTKEEAAKSFMNERIAQYLNRHTYDMEDLGFEEDLSFGNAVFRSSTSDKMVTISLIEEKIK